MGNRESGKDAPRSGPCGEQTAAPRPVDPVAIGIVVGPHGTRGALRVRAFGSGRHLRRGMEPVIAGAKRRISAARETPKGFLVQLEDIESRIDTEPLKGEELLLDRDELDAPDDGEFYVTDLVGLTAVNGAREKLGVVGDTFETAAHEVLVVRKPDGHDLYVPFTLEHVPELDLESGRLVIRPPES